MMYTSSERRKMTKDTCESKRVHAVIIMKGPVEKLDPDEMHTTTCKRKLPLKNMVKTDEALQSASQCSLCHQALRNYLTLRKEWMIVYLREE